MRTNIEIDDALLKEAMEITGLQTKKATVEEALRRIVRNADLKKVIAEMHGLGWEGDLDQMREGRVFDPLP
ncbi:transcriptional regulator [Bosea sp. PAMC 26642]|nr:type II toxin-antitoxin system VapB family antitoxin [Bosea sp. PAMC 26642]AMJ63805.1 transcriptional regulator [Bosea sp. PAMC 26642]